jgi:hypothetical protein
MTKLPVQMFDGGLKAITHVWRRIGADLVIVAALG